MVHEKLASEIKVDVNGELKVLDKLPLNESMHKKVFVITYVVLHWQILLLPKPGHTDILKLMKAKPGKNI